MKKIIAIGITILITLAILPLWVWTNVDDGDLLAWIIANQVGQIASILGVMIALVGFILTIRAATRAENAATKALESVRRVETVENISKATAILEEILRMNRDNKNWNIVLDRHLSVRNLLGEIKSANVNITELQKTTIQATITHSVAIANKIEIALGKDQIPTGIAQMNKVLSEQVDNLNSVRVEIRHE
jgi:hypothetical protein